MEGDLQEEEGVWLSPWTLELLPHVAGRPKKGGIEGEEEWCLVVVSRLGEDERSSFEGLSSGLR